MVRTAKKVNMYRLALRRGTRYRMELTDDDRLRGTGGGYFAWLAPVFDSMDMGNTWHRLRLTGTFENCKYEVLAAATDADLREAPARDVDLYAEILRVDQRDILADDSPRPDFDTVAHILQRAAQPARLLRQRAQVQFYKRALAVVFFGQHFAAVDLPRADLPRADLRLAHPVVSHRLASSLFF